MISSRVGPLVARASYAPSSTRFSTACAYVVDVNVGAEPGSVLPSRAPYEGRDRSVHAHQTWCSPACRLTEIVPRDHHRRLSTDLVAQRTGKPREFDRARSAPVPWTMPVLRALFACPCIPRSSGWPRVSDCGRSTARKQWGFLSPSNQLSGPTLYPAPPSAQIPGWLCSNGEPREQAHIPAQQPSKGQDPRLPPAHAHARRPSHPCCSSRQGSLRTVRLRLDACCQRVIVCEAAPISPQFFEGHAEQVDLVQAAASSWFMSTRPMRVRVNRRASVLSSLRPWATPWSATAPNASCGLS